MKAFLILLVLAALAVSLLAATILICPKCGVENPRGNVECVHCGMSLPETGEDTAGSEAVPPATASDIAAGHLAGGPVDAEIAKGSEYLDKKEAGVAGLFFANASALEMLTDPDARSGRPERILQLIRQCDEKSGIVRRSCPDCDGTGRSKLKTTNLRGEIVTQEAQSGTCRTCGGRRYIVGKETVSDKKYRMGRALEQYRSARTGDTAPGIHRPTAQSKHADYLRR